MKVYLLVGSVLYLAAGIAGQCSPSPCGVNTQCDVNPAGAAVCRNLTFYPVLGYKRLSNFFDRKTSDISDDHFNASRKGKSNS